MMFKGLKQRIAGLSGPNEKQGSMTNSEAPVFLFFGYAWEYTLHPLFEYMNAHGDDCVEIDMLTHPDVVGALRQLEGRPVVLLTSAHPLFDDKNFFFYKTHRKVVSALHVISTLNPVASVYYPHDLKDPIKEEEIFYLPVFDLLLSPFPGMQRFSELLSVVQVGWIKRVPKTERIMPEEFNPSRKVFFTGAYHYYLKLGMERFYDDFRVLFDSGVACKLTKSHENEAFEKFLRDRNVNVYPSHANSLHIMDENDVIFTQALSSVGLESCMLGKKVVYIRHGHLDYKDPEVELKGAGNITFVNSPQEAAALDRASLPGNTERMGYFDFALARSSVWEAYNKMKSNQGTMQREKNNLLYGMSE